jgi:hypothetical protein
MLKEKIQTNLNEAVKNRDELKSGTLRLILASILTKEKEKRYKLSKENSGISESDLEKEALLSDEEIIDVLSSEAKKRKEAILGFEKGNRPEMAEKEKQELAILAEYLPEQISEEELKKIVSDAIEKTGAKEIKDMGRIMAIVMPQIKGRADGSQVSQIAKSIMGN